MEEKVVVEIKIDWGEERLGGTGWEGMNRIAVRTDIQINELALIVLHDGREVGVRTTKYRFGLNSDDDGSLYE